MSGSTEWRTPPHVFDKLAREFHFNVDAAATAENSLVGLHRNCPVCYRFHGRYYTADTDGTKLEHYGPEDVVWCNPPYSPSNVLAAFVRTASESSKAGALWVVLLNATCRDTRWWHNYIWDRELGRPRDRVEVRESPGRLTFNKPDGTPGPQPRYGNVLVIFHPPLKVLK